MTDLGSEGAEDVIVPEGFSLEYPSIKVLNYTVIEILRDNLALEPALAVGIAASVVAQITKQPQILFGPNPRFEDIDMKDVDFWVNFNQGMIEARERQYEQKNTKHPEQAVELKLPKTWVISKSVRDHLAAFALGIASSGTYDVIKSGISVPSTQAETVIMIVVTGDDVRLGFEPSYNGSVLTKLDSGTQVMFIADVGEWSNVMLLDPHAPTNNKMGWVHRKYLQQINPN